MALQNFTSYTEVDANNFVTVAENTVSWAALQSRDRTVYVEKDFGADHFSGDFTHTFKCVLTSSSGTTPYVAVWGLANSTNNFQGIDDGGGDYLAVLHVTSTLLQLRKCENGTVGIATNITVEAGITYFVTISRDDDGGAASTGQLSLHVGTGNYYGQAGYSEVAARTLDMGAGEQNDFRYLYALSTFNTGDSNRLMTGSVSDLNINEVSLVEAEATASFAVSGAAEAVAMEIVEAAAAASFSIAGVAHPISNIAGQLRNAALVAAGNNQLWYEE